MSNSTLRLFVYQDRGFWRATSLSDCRTKKRRSGEGEDGSPLFVPIQTEEDCLLAMPRGKWCDIQVRPLVQRYAEEIEARMYENGERKPYLYNTAFLQTLVVSWTLDWSLSEIGNMPPSIVTDLVYQVYAHLGEASAVSENEGFFD